MGHYYNFISIWKLPELFHIWGSGNWSWLKRLSMVYKVKIISPRRKVQFPKYMLNRRNSVTLSQSRIESQTLKNACKCSNNYATLAQSHPNNLGQERMYQPDVGFPSASCWPVHITMCIFGPSITAPLRTFQPACHSSSSNFWHFQNKRCQQLREF